MSDPRFHDATPAERAEVLKLPEPVVYAWIGEGESTRLEDEAIARYLLARPARQP